MDETLDNNGEAIENEGSQGDAAQGAAGTEPKEPTPKDDTNGDEGVTDKHGQPGINRDKYQRDIKAKDEEIARLKAEIKEKSDTEEGRKALESKLEAIEQQLKDERLNHQLEKAGCRNNKAARALLDDYEGDIKKLKEGEPWLFDDGKPKGSTGAKPGGAIDADKKQEARLRKIAGLPPKE